VVDLHESGELLELVLVEVLVVQQRDDLELVVLERAVERVLVALDARGLARRPALAERDVDEVALDELRVADAEEAVRVGDLGGRRHLLVGAEAELLAQRGLDVRAELRELGLLHAAERRGLGLALVEEDGLRRESGGFERRRPTLAVDLGVDLGLERGEVAVVKQGPGHGPRQSLSSRRTAPR